MLTLEKATVVDFLEWVRKNEPSVRSLGELPKDRFICLATRYEKSKRKDFHLESGSALYKKWDYVGWAFRQGPSISEALAKYPESVVNYPGPEYSG